MSAAVIRVEDLGKTYVLGSGTGSAPAYRRFSEAIMERLATGLTRTNPAADGNHAAETFWALRNVSFEVAEGEVLGIIGRNGAGKSTLLKILSRITEPSEGRARLRGRVSSLLEVGTGFHPELSGRENIYLNGAILGMRRQEIHRSFDEIVAFSEVERFLDTPVKRYSSGMYVRLAFAVAAHLRTDILIVDEVLAVGDSRFQKKCLGKMAEVAGGGRTVLFVSHNLQAVASLCSRALVLEQGRAVFAGGAEAAVQCYLGSAPGNTAIEYQAPRSVSHPHCTAVRVGQVGRSAQPLAMHEPIHVDVTIDLGDEPEATCTLVVTNSQGLWVCHCTEEFGPGAEGIRKSARRRCVLPAHLLNADHYSLTVALGSRAGGQLYEKLTDILQFDVSFTGPGADRNDGAAFRGVSAPGIATWSVLQD